MKKIVIHSQDGINPQVKLWAREAAQEFLDMFPEYKNSFQIAFRDDEQSLHKEITQAEYDALPDSHYKRQFIKTTEGTWLVPYESMAWFLAQAKKPNPRGGPDKIDVSNLMALQKARIEQKANDEVVVSLVKGEFKQSCYGYAFEKFGSVLSVDACREKEFFKTIFIHELGHVFRATHEHRGHIIKQKGFHCTNHLCIMGAGNYEQLRDERLRRKALGHPPFCDECIASMREYMEQMPELTKEIQVEQFYRNLPELPHNNDEWKREFRTFYQNVANRDGDIYSEDDTAHNYIARIKRSNGTSLEIEANNEYNVAIGAKDTNGRDEMPSIKDMKDLVKLAQSKNSGMNFGKDNEPEFNARLLIACLEATPQPLEMRNQPEITSEFLTQLQPETRRHLQSALNPPSRTLQSSQQTR